MYLGKGEGRSSWRKEDIPDTIGRGGTTDDYGGNKKGKRPNVVRCTRYGKRGKRLNDLMKRFCIAVIRTKKNSH